MNDFPRHDAQDKLIILGRASIETLGDMGLDEPEGGPPVGGIAED